MFLSLYILGFVVIFEVSLMLMCHWTRKHFQWLINKKDEYPNFNVAALNKFFKNGFDPELGWIRKPNTSNTEKSKYGESKYHIDSLGSRVNPGHEKLENTIACFGDSFTFCRQVNDNETFQWYLSEQLGQGILNFGVGNYGLDQALLRLEREIHRINPKIVLIGVVPSTIVRILCLWKHYNEYGNTFAFKPMFKIINQKLSLIPNYINCKDKFKYYKNFLTQIQKDDWFYYSKFKREMVKFPYIWTVMKNFNRNISIIFLIMLGQILKCFKIKNKKILDAPLQKIMEINLQLRIKLFNQDYPKQLFNLLINKFIELSKIHNFTPLFVLLPQKDDVLYIKKTNNFYYSEFIDELIKKLDVIDLTNELIKRDDIDSLYSDDGVYGGHFCKEGNFFVSKIIYKYLNNNNLN